MSHTATAAATPPDQYDTLWKQAIERYFPEFMAFFFPQAFTQIGWSRGYTFLENELVAITLNLANALSAAIKFEGLIFNFGDGR